MEEGRKEGAVEEGTMVEEWNDEGGRSEETKGKNQRRRSFCLNQIFLPGVVHPVRVFSARLRSSDDSWPELRHLQRRILRTPLSQD